MKTAGVSGKTAWLMYQAVENFGPKWEAPRLAADCEIIDDDYDFARCAPKGQNRTRILPALSKGKLQEFVNDLESEADPDDLKKLKKAISTM